MRALILLGLAVAFAAAAPGWLVRAAWVYRSPRLGVLAWLAVAVTLLTSATAAALALVMPWHPAHDAVCGLWRICLDALTGAHGLLAQAVAWLAALVLAAGVVRLAGATGTVARAGRQRRDHAALVRLVGQGRPDLQATVVERPEPAVYLVPGRGGQVVLTTGALDRLSGDELAAVLAHERAHARGKHHRPLVFAGLLQAAFPPVRLFRQAHRQVSRLVEMCADDRASRDHPPLALARALAALACPTPAPGILASSGGDAAERVHRLMCPPQPLPRTIQSILVAGLLALPLAPLAVLYAGPVLAALGPPIW